MARPVAYLRKSRSDDPSREISRDVQERAVRELAARDGHQGELEWFVDWNVSADESKSQRRKEFNRLIRSLEAGQVSVVHTSPNGRLAPSRVAARLVCEAAPSWYALESH